MRILYRPNQYSQQRQKEKARWIYPVLLAMQAEYNRNLGHEVFWDYPMPCDKVVTEPEDIDFLKLPPPNRYFSNAFDSRYMANGNFKYLPGTYIQVANGCWWGKCEFCVEKKNKWKVRPVESVIKELKECNEMGFKEVFDDSGSFPTGIWLNEFLGSSNPGVVLGCNSRMVEMPWSRMKHWGFRMILFGIESANQTTLDRINKGTSVEDIRHIQDAAKAGLDCHGAFMIFPWETHEETMRTIDVVKKLLINGTLKTAQCSLYDIGTRNEAQRKYVGMMYEVAYSPKFWFNKLINIRTKDDFNYLLRQIKEGLGNH